MKKLLAVLMIVSFTAAVLSPAVFANCGSKAHGGTKTTDQPKPKTTSA